MRHIKKIRAGAVILFASAITICGTIQNHMRVEQSEPVFAVGAAKALSVENTEPLTLTSGVANVLSDYEGENSAGEIAVAKSQTNMVTAGQQEETQEADTDICGYRNLGIAVVDDTLNIRENASTDSDIVGKMTPNAACEIVGTEGEWTQITSGNVTGYVKSEYLVSGDEARTIAEGEKKLIATVNTDTLRVRTQATTDAEILALVGNGEQITALSHAQDGWVQVEVDDVQGYVSAEFVDLSETLPTAQSMTELKYGAGVSDARVSLVAYACQFVGNPYVWGGTSLTNGADCSGFTLSIFAKYGIYLPHSSRAQPNCGTIISASEAQPGDLFFYGSGNSISHVAIYIGNGQIVHASNETTGIIISNAFYRTPICVSNVLGN